MDIGLQTTISTILSQLANFFGATIETVTQNAPYWLAKYGWYSVIGNIGGNLFGGAFLAGIAFAAIALISCGILENDTIPPKTTVVICLITFILPIAISLAHCAIAPEIYGLEALINLIK